MGLQPWDIVFLVGFVAYIAIRGVYAGRTKGNQPVLRRVGTSEKALMTFVISTSLLLPVLYLATPWLGFADYELPAWAPWCGAVFMAAALWLFWRSHADLGLNWSPTLEIQRGHILITGGVYRRIRHPMYASIFLFSLGQGLLLENWLAGWSALVTFAVLYVARTPHEEQMMCDVFGDEYREYMRHTGRLWPRLR